MTVRLIISEKPKVAEKLAGALSKGKALRKVLHGVAYFELERQDGKVLVAPAVGHVYSLKAKQKGGGYPVFDIEWVPSSEQGKGAEYTEKYLKALKSLSKKADEVVNACDWDVEGSLIGGNIIRFVFAKTPAHRMLFSTLTDEDLIAAFNDLKPLDTPQVQAGEARHILDWFWGINSSRALMSAIRKGGTFRILSIGRVQGPTLAILARREQEIAAFVPSKYWQVFAFLKKVEFTHKISRFKDEKEAKDAFVDGQSVEEAVVERVESQKYKQAPPVPFNLTSLQLEAHKLFGFDPSRTLRVAQSLYEAALISYPRTSSQKLSEKLGLKNIISKLGKSKAYSGFALFLIGKNMVKPNEGKKTDAAHPAIHPTGLLPGVKLREEELKLFDLIVKRFFAIFGQPAVRQRVKVTARLSSQLFSVTGNSTVEKNWFEFYEPYVKFDEVSLPFFVEGEKVKVEKVDLQEKLTQPPKRYSSASLVKKLEAENLGTKATRSEVIQTLYNRGYVVDKSITVTPLGIAVFNALEFNVKEILSEKLTRKFEREMEDIQNGKIQAEGVVEAGKRTLTRILENFKEKEQVIGDELAVALKQTRKEASVLGGCRLCASQGREGNLILRKSRFGLFVGCSSYPACKAVFPLPKQALVKPLKKTCEKCSTPMVTVIRKGKRPFNMCLDPNCELKANWGKKKEEKKAKSKVVKKKATKKKVKKKSVGKKVE